ncbi:MAG TPA: helix-turn-helix transcriptional regulator [Gemmatimonadales bacterium]|nr:helix-turn-helix transcriptional regulator [Gemmatimonadales bacterium]
MVTVCTLLSSPERPRLDAAGEGCFTTLHVDSLRDALTTARRRRVDALVVSVHRCPAPELAGLARFVREFPAIPAVALVSHHDGVASDALLQLGASGVRVAVDCTEPGGWRKLREVVGHPASPAAAAILERVLPAIDEAAADARLFFDSLARLAPVLPTGRALARHLQIPPTTVTSRFRRAGLPSPKRYLSAVRLVHAAYLFQTPGLAVADVAYRLDYSSPQSFGRHVKARFGLTAAGFRAGVPFELAVGRFVAELILPYREALLAFHPLTPHRTDGSTAPSTSRAGD